MVASPSREFIYYWYRELGWNKNPFDALLSHPRLVAGYEKERKQLNYFVIQNLPLCFVEAEDGFGKSSLFHWLLHELKMYPQKVIVGPLRSDASQDDYLRLFVSSVMDLKDKAVGKLSSRFGFGKKHEFESLFKDYFSGKNLDFDQVCAFLASRRTKKSLVLCVDSVSKSFLEKLGFFVSLPLQVFVTGKKEVFKGVPLTQKPMRLYLKGLNYADMMDLLSKRIHFVGGSHFGPFSMKELKELHGKSGKSPKEFLSLVHDRAVHYALEHLKFRKDPRSVKDLHAKSVDLEALGRGETHGGKDSAPRKYNKVRMVLEGEKSSSKPYTIRKIDHSSQRVAVKKVKKKVSRKRKH